jgi:hypothetical protein
MGKVTPIKLSQEAQKAALKLLRETAADDLRVSFLVTMESSAWRRFFDNRQIMRCLREGSLVKPPCVDELGNMVFVLERHAAGATIEVTAVLEGTLHGDKVVIVTEFTAGE